jgi:hypothetical protein
MCRDGVDPCWAIVGGMQDYEQRGTLYLAHRYDVDDGKVDTDPLLYDAKYLAIHAVCLGMTGSRKCGLVVTLIQEAAIVFRTRWALSYLNGPLTWDQIKGLPR